MGWLNRKTSKVAVAVLSGVLLQIAAVAQNVKSSTGAEARLLKKALLENHIQPRLIDDVYSGWVYDHVLDELDPERLYFTQNDLKTLSASRDKIDDELNGSAWTFVPHLTQLYKKCLERYKVGVNEIAGKTIDFSSEQYLDVDSTWSTDNLDLKKQWNLTFRYNTEERLLDLQRRAPEKTEKEFLSKHEGQVRQQIQKVMIREADRILNQPLGFEEYVTSQFFKCMAMAFDPHTAYLSPQQMQNFISSLSTQGYYFGISLGENERGEIFIVQLMPGGPAWKSGEIHKGDVLQVLRWEGHDPVDLWGIDLDEVNEMLMESNSSLLEITLRKSDGTLNVVKLRKEKVTSEESIVKSFVLEGSRKIGYISLPDFYTDWGDADGSKCASDVAREIIKLKRENIEGLILDVRFNGGGSMTEAVAMAGIFIDAGPVGVIKNKAAELQTVKDLNRGTIYDGPLVIMVNSLSASASEFLAAALQDYNRAIIVGGRTYGKATAQQLVPTNSRVTTDKVRPVQPRPKAEAISYVSVTVQKLYRITGKTAQQVGVVPDVMLPDALQSLPVREVDLPLSFSPDSIQKKVYYQPLPALPLRELKEKSSARLTTQPQFAALGQLGTQITKLKINPGKIALRWSDFQKFYAEYTRLGNEIESSSNVATKLFTADKLEEESPVAPADSYMIEFNESWIKNLQEDIFLHEAFHIICDFVPHVTKK